ncbi:MAG: hypothetical protein ACRDQV_09220 [Pseudonocardiaceae bacterium]
MSSTWVAVNSSDENIKLRSLRRELAAGHAPKQAEVGQLNNGRHCCAASSTWLSRDC